MGRLPGKERFEQRPADPVFKRHVDERVAQLVNRAVTEQQVDERQVGEAAVTLLVFRSPIGDLADGPATKLIRRPLR